MIRKTSYFAAGMSLLLAGVATVSLALSAPTAGALPILFVAPSVTGISPSSGSPSGGTTVTIEGTGFDSTATVSFGLIAATSVFCNTADSCTAVSPPGIGNVDVTVNDGIDGGTSATSPNDLFQYTGLPARIPSVVSVSPSSGPTLGGTLVTVTGLEFTASTTFKFGQNSATSVSCPVSTTNSCTMTSPAGSVGTVDITADNGSTSPTSAADHFAYVTPPTPTISQVSPSSGPSSGGTAVTITGTGFISATTVAFSSTAATAVNCSSSTTCTATSPAGSGSVDVTASNGGLTSATSSADRFSYSPGPAPSSGGYDLVGSDGGVFVFGSSTGYHGSLPGLNIHVNNIVGIVPNANDTGYFLVGSDGGVFAFNTNYAGSLPGIGVHVNNIVGIVPNANDTGYFLVGSDGGVFAFNTGYSGSLPGEGVTTNDIVGIAPTADDNGYWVVSSSGTVYAFGDAASYGGANPGSAQIKGIVATPDSKGYWLVASNGAVFTQGDAANYGSLTQSGVSASNIVALVPTGDGKGYWLIGSNGGVFTYGDANNLGSLPSLGVSVNNVVGGVPTSS